MNDSTQNQPERSPTGEIVDQELGLKTETTKETQDSTDTTGTKQTTESTEKSSSEAKDDEGKSLLTKKADAPVIPDKYELKAPEGFTLNEATTKEAGELIKGLGLTQDGAQKLLAFHYK